MTIYNFIYQFAYGHVNDQIDRLLNQIGDSLIPINSRDTKHVVRP